MSENLVHEEIEKPTGEGYEGPVTEVTSVAKEEARTGTKVETPSPEELVQRASMSLIGNLRFIQQIFNAKKGTQLHISKRGQNRAILAGLKLPEDGVPVDLKSESEKLLFAMIQRTIADRYLILTHHINEEKKKLAEQVKEAQDKVEETDTNPKTQKEETNE